MAYFGRISSSIPAGFRFPVFLSILRIYSEPKTQWNRGIGQNMPYGTQRGPSTESKGGGRKAEGGSLTEQSEHWALMTSTYYDDASRQTKWRTVSVCADVRVSMER